MAKTKWETEFNIILDNDLWQKLRMSIFQICSLTKYQSFQYRMLSNRITTNSMRNIWDINVPPDCTFCNNAKETMIHLFWECTHVKKIVRALERWINYILGIRIEIKSSEWILCSVVGQNSELINVIYMIAKQYIYASKCCNVKLNFMDLARKLFNVYTDEKYVAFVTNRVYKFEKIWCKYCIGVLKEE